MKRAAVTSRRFTCHETLAGPFPLRTRQKRVSPEQRKQEADGGGRAAWRRAPGFRVAVPWLHSDLFRSARLTQHRLSLSVAWLQTGQACAERTLYWDALNDIF
ncbi:hypothetical protein CesoFtcFv8_022517 [Champsocephalus esox]|uniref:Uncharacterized protein n=1 Tax=Champsocephalus esox TaxID=159716 RepID=A0AAN8BB16_9TELE|nr:hypothetical protein CesoFtcFv8_022517 [Champsocephalus esox]